MILPFPLVTSDAIAAALRPASRLQTDSALRTLKRRALAGVAISVVPRAAGGVHGRVVYYSSLMLDVARCVRWGDIASAARLARISDELAGSRAARFVAEALVGGFSEADGSDLDERSGGALSRLALLTEQQWQQAVSPTTELMRLGGIVVDHKAGSAIVRTEDGWHVAIPGDLDAGTPVFVVIERGESASLLTAHPAVTTSPDPNSRTPAEPILLRTDEWKLFERDPIVVG